MIDFDKLVPAPERPSYEDLAVQLIDAAIDLNRIERGEISDSAKIAAVLANLGLRDRQVRTGDDLRQAVDPQTIDIYSRVFPKLTSEPTRDIDDLAAHVQKYSTLSNNIGQSSPADLLAMKKFFLALHRELLAENYSRLEESMPDRV